MGLNRFQARMFRRIHGLDRMAVDFEIDMFDMISVPARELLRARNPTSSRRSATWSTRTPPPT